MKCPCCGSSLMTFDDVLPDMVWDGDVVTVKYKGHCRSCWAKLLCAERYVMDDQKVTVREEASHGNA